MGRKRVKEKDWRQIQGKPKGYEYEYSSGHVAIRIPKDGWFQEYGPARLIGGDVDATVRQLLREVQGHD